VSRPQLGVRSHLQRFSDRRYWRGLRRLEQGSPPEYRDYLEEQLRRSLSKRSIDSGVGAEVLVREVARHCTPKSSVLCIGCRNTAELDRFRAKGLEPVGIDLFAQGDGIAVMDMHELRFDADSFDAVYASHSLEHSYDLATVVAEIRRVARSGAVVGVEVPVRHKGSDADRVVFSGSDDLRVALMRQEDAVLYEEEQPPNSPTNGQGSSVVRLVFQLES
jgi:SAM-dependent methyltransferase